MKRSSTCDFLDNEEMLFCFESNYTFFFFPLDVMLTFQKISINIRYGRPKTEATSLINIKIWNGHIAKTHIPE